MDSRLTIHGDEVWIGDRRFRRKLRWYVLALPRTAVASATVSGKIRIDPNSAPFLCLSTHVNDTADGNALTSQEDYSLMVQDNEGGYNWGNDFIPRAAFAGSREFGYNLPEPWAIRANTEVNFQIQNKPAPGVPVAGVATIILRGWHLFE